MIEGEVSQLSHLLLMLDEFGDELNGSEMLWIQKNIVPDLTNRPRFLVAQKNPKAKN
jgi:hypothetical protein